MIYGICKCLLLATVVKNTAASVFITIRVTRVQSYTLDDCIAAAHGVAVQMIGSNSRLPRGESCV